MLVEASSEIIFFCFALYLINFLYYNRCYSFNTVGTVVSLQWHGSFDKVETGTIIPKFRKQYKVVRGGLQSAINHCVIKSEIEFVTERSSSSKLHDG